MPECKEALWALRIITRFCNIINHYCSALMCLFLYKYFVFGYHFRSLNWFFPLGSSRSLTGSKAFNLAYMVEPATVDARTTGLLSLSSQESVVPLLNISIFVSLFSRLAGSFFFEWVDLPPLRRLKRRKMS